MTRLEKSVVKRTQLDFPTLPSLFVYGPLKNEAHPNQQSG